MSYAATNPNEGKKNILTIILIVLFFIIAYKCESQIERVQRYHNSPNIVTKFPQEPMEFGSDEIDKIVVNICADSLSPIKQRVIVFAFYPREVKGELKIGFADGDFATLKEYKVDENYVEYLVEMDDFIKLKNKKFDYLSFGNIAQCTQIIDGYFFVKFIKEL